MKAHIDVFGRIRPNNNRVSEMNYKLKEDKRTVMIQIPKNVRLGYVNNTKENMEFRFTEIFNQNASQEDVFDRVAKPVVNNCLDGYNGTIFAYGQTGSGKTYTMSGAETWQLRGVIPRVLSFLFDEFERRSNIEYNMYISFMEIYNEVAYDLLDRRHIEMSLESWNKVMLMEDDYGNIHLKNLSVHQCYSEQDGIDLLMMGNFIRQVSSTPLNQSSSRSHAIFTITLEGKNLDSETYFVSKLHLVDLAGSERISKSNVEGSLLTEAKHINLSLTYLEQVIIALHEKSLGNRQHIPYRNSLMTTILRDSLGGNCKTVMIANLSPDVDNLEETISTSRFAQRCSLLVNEIKKNERIDLNVLVKRLEFENIQLREELEYFKLHSGGKGGKGGKLELDNKPAQSGKKNGATAAPEEEPEEHKLTQFEYFEISANVEAYLNDKMDNIQLKNLTEANAYIKSMKDFYCSRMREYIGELNIISHKLKKYEEILAKRRSQANSKNQSNNSIDYYAEEEVLNYDAYAHENVIKDSTNNYGYDMKDPMQGGNGYQGGYNYDRNAKENGYNYQGPNQSQNQKRPPPNNAEKKIGFYNFPKTYQTEAIIEAPDESD